MDLQHKHNCKCWPYISEKQKVIVIRRWHVRLFFKLLDKLKSFLEADKCNKLADNYLIAMIFTYFLRASLEPEEYTKQNFFGALLLAFNMEEDDIEYLLSELDYNIEYDVADIKESRYKLFRRIDYRASVSRTCCETVMRSANPEHEVWQRIRHVYHSGVVSKKSIWTERLADICPVCGGEDSEDEINY